MSRNYATRMNHIKALNVILSARDDFDALELRKHNDTGKEYLFLKDIVGHIFIFDVTGFPLSGINHTLAEVECGKRPSNLISDNSKKLEIARLFR